MTLTKIDIKNALNGILEDELIDIISEFKIVHFDANIRIGGKNAEIQYIPLVVRGKFKAIRVDKHGNDIPIYDINVGQSCAITIASAMHERKTQLFSIPEIDSSIVLIPKEYSEEWIGKYPLWRKLIFDLYDLRMQELINQHELVREQHDKIALQQQNLHDSIMYAKRIQQAMLPQQRYISQILPQHFILYEPRDIVSGDFYWLTKLITTDTENKNTEYLIVAAADCTGHGVPGALMSILGISLLNEIIGKLEKPIASNILNELRDKLKRSLNQSGAVSETKDGMDIALCVIDLENKKMQFAGAYNPMYLVRNNEFIQVKADKMPIGIYINEKESFSNQIVDIETGDMLYLFSDGYIDQFGGTENRKFLSKRFKQLLTDIAPETIENQKTILKDTLIEWKGKTEQVDDILVMGVKL